MYSNESTQKCCQIEESVNLSFKNISYSVKKTLFSKEKIKILKNVNGEFKSGKLNAIIGSSGAGKSTLLNILSGFITKNVEGGIYHNGELTSEEYGRSCSYIMQNNNLHPLLTVEEVMNFAADLKIPKSISSEEKQERINALIESVGLQNCHKILTNKLSGGEMRRLSICVELIQNSSILFIDEPTTGLDNVSAKNIISLLSDLAKENRTIICTLHQPGATILKKVDHLYCLVDGYCTYQGTVKDILPYLETFDPPFTCPNYYDPTDFLLDVCTGVYGDNIDVIVEKSQNGNVTIQSSTEKDSKTFQNKNSLKKPKQIYATSFINQTLAVIKRNYTMTLRDTKNVLMRLMVNFTTAMIVGYIYFQIGEDGKHALDNFHFIFFTALWIMYSAFCSMLAVFSNEIDIIIKEHFNRWYSVISFYVGITLADLPVLLLDTLVYAIISYLMTGQPLEWFRIGLFLLMTVLSALVAQSIAVMYGAYLRFEVSAFLGPMSLAPFVIFCGYFIHVSDAPYFFSCFFDITFMRYSLEGILHSIMGFGRKKLPCSDIYCHFANPIVALKQLGLDEERVALDITVLICHYIVLKIAAYFALNNRIGGKR